MCARAQESLPGFRAFWWDGASPKRCGLFRRISMHGSARVALAGLVLTASVSQSCHPKTPPPLELELGTGVPVVFPPSDETWSARAPLPPHMSLSSPSSPSAESSLRIASPILDDRGHFEIQGQTIHFAFGEPAVDLANNGRAKQSAPTITIAPPIAGRTLWTDSSDVEFRAEKPFDPLVEYTLTLPGFTSPEGRTFPDGFKATFRADPIVEVAGKTIYYIPKAGHARPLAMSPSADSDTLLGGSQRVRIVYDQPVDLSLANTLVAFSDAQDKKVAVVLRHPDRSAFEGQRVDARLIVDATPRVPLKAGETLHVTANSEHKGDDGTSQHYVIAEPATLLTVACSGDECETKDLVIKGEPGSSLRLRYSNPVGDVREAKHVHISPKPNNLYVSGGNELGISASFTPSTVYKIQTEGLVDSYGGRIPPLAFTFETRALPASASMSEGTMILDEEATRAFPVTTRNVSTAELALWPLPKGDVEAFARALAGQRLHAEPQGEPLVLPFTPLVMRDHNVETKLDLTAKLDPGRAYVAQVRRINAAHGARPLQYPKGSEASFTPTALLFATGNQALAAHVHQAGEKSVIQVFRPGSGEPIANARVAIGAVAGSTDSNGAVALTTALTAPGEERILAVAAGGSELMLPLGPRATDSRSLFPDLASGEGGVNEKADTRTVGMLVTDRGVYRPGSPMFIKGFVRTPDSTSLRALAGARVRLRVIDPRNTDIIDEVLTTTARGGLTKEVSFAKSSPTGRYQIRLELEDGKHTRLASDVVRVADFEAPRFKVDIENESGVPSEPQHLKARILGRYLFGAPMAKAHVNWALKKSRVAVKGGVLAEAGLSFERDDDGLDNTPNVEALRPVTGEGELGDDGALALDIATGALADGPTELALEADVTDASNRHISGQLRGVRDPFARYAGLKLSRRFGEAGRPLSVELGVVDTQGNAVLGARITARLERLKWTRVAEKAESGATLEKWKNVATPEAECEVTSAAKAVACALAVQHGGSFRVVTRIDGRDDAATSFWAYGNWAAGERESVPSEGKKVPLVLDKGSYKAGDTAQLLVQNPFEKATALVTFEQGGILRFEARRIETPSATFDVPVSAVDSPWLYATVTLLPLGETEADYRVGVVRINVSADDAKLDVRVMSAKKSYQVHEEAEITVEVRTRKDGKPVKNADVTLGVVDESVLRLTAYHPKDPVTTLRPGRGLDFRLTDSREAMLRRREKAHTGGGGDSAGEESLDTRKNFVETAAWQPDLVTDNDGRAKVKVKLPDSLTEFRMTAVVVDDVGGGGTAESSFVVTKAFLLEPVMPRFALRGDTFEAAAMVHNNTDAKVTARVTIAGEKRDVTLEPRSRQRVAIPMSTSTAGVRKLLFSLDVAGASQDKVELELRVDEPGIDEHPMISGVFGDRQEVRLAIPADALFEPGAVLSIKTGSALYPELGQRLSYLLDYPHGCVEQTTSGTLPLLAARTILPWTGTATMDDNELRKRIDAGITRLASMQTPSGGLAYWPGGDTADTEGTAYAMRALLQAKELGIERPKLIERVTRFLGSVLEGTGEQSEPSQVTRMEVAEVLAMAHALPASLADSLYDAREKLTASGLASLAVALSSVPHQEDRVREVLDRLEIAFDAGGEEAKPTGATDGQNEAHATPQHVWGSHDRTRAQAAIAFARLRKSSKLLPVLALRLSKTLERYSTQSTAWSLMALSEYIGTRRPNGDVDVGVKLSGKRLKTSLKLGGDNKEVHVPLQQLAGTAVSLVLTGEARTASAFAIEAHYKRPLAAAGSRLARRGAHGVSLYRVYSDAAGRPLDLENVKPGQVVRVAVRVELPKLDQGRLSYLAVTDRLPAGFEALNTDLATTGSLPELRRAHPFFEGLSRYGSAASYIDLKTDRVSLYFDHVHDGRAVYASYLARATTPGTFRVPPANGELMYEPASDGYTDARSITVR